MYVELLNFIRKRDSRRIRICCFDEKKMILVAFECCFDKRKNDSRRIRIRKKIDLENSTSINFLSFIDACRII